jgi:hypothetical protein
MSHIARITARSCEMSSSAAPRSRTERSTTSSTCTWIVASSPVVGSSAISSAGSQISAIAIATRCAMPPLNWCG